MLPVLVSILPYGGLIAAAFAVYAFFRDMRRDIGEIKDNHLTHLLDATKDQTQELREMRADFRTYFAPQPGAAPVSVTVNPVITNEQNKSRDLAVPA